ncbi:hypothetical protein EDB84DRAFT_1682147, partial [Lactarius hengduanensis]
MFTKGERRSNSRSKRGSGSTSLPVWPTAGDRCGSRSSTQFLREGNGCGRNKHSSVPLDPASYPGERGFGNDCRRTRRRGHTEECFLFGFRETDQINGEEQIGSFMRAQAEREQLQGRLAIPWKKAHMRTPAPPMVTSTAWTENPSGAWPGCSGSTQSITVRSTWPAGSVSGDGDGYHQIRYKKRRAHAEARDFERSTAAAERLRLGGKVLLACLGTDLGAGKVFRTVIDVVRQTNGSREGSRKNTESVIPSQDNTLDNCGSIRNSAGFPRRANRTLALSHITLTSKTFFYQYLRKICSTASASRISGRGTQNRWIGQMASASS